MSYTPATKMPDFPRLQLSTPTYPAPTLNGELNGTDTTSTVYFSAPLKAYNKTTGTYEILTGGININIRKSNGYTEKCWIPAGNVAADGLSATGVVRGVRTSGLDYTTGDSSLVQAHSQGEPIYVGVDAVDINLLQAALQGLIASGGTTFKNGDGTDSDIYYYAKNADANPPYLKYNKTSNAWFYSADGVTEMPFGGANDMTAGDGIDIAAGVIAVDILADYGLYFASGELRLKLKTDSGLDADTNGLQVDLAATPGLEFSTGLQVKVKSGGGITKDADGLSLDDIYYPTATGIADEAITAGQFVAEIPYEVEWFTQLTDVAINIGNSNTTRKYSVKFTPPKNITGWTAIYLRLAEAVDNATALGNVIVSIQTDNAGSPSGTLAHANATVTYAQATQRTDLTTAFSSKSLSWAGAVSLTKGTVYHLVIECSATDGTNYLKIGVNSTYDENYCTFTRKTYNLDTSTWGGAVTNATPFFWGNVSLGSKLVPTDANFGRRTWGARGVASAAYAADETVTYYHDVVPSTMFGTALTPGATYYISETAGGITVTPPNGALGASFRLRIGEAFEDENGNVSLKIKKGEKFIWGTQAVSATATYPIITWFKPAYVRAIAGSTGAGQFWGMGIGYYDGTTNAQYGSVSGATLYDDNDGSTQDNTGTGASITNAGFSLSNTNSGAAATVFMEIYE